MKNKTFFSEAIRNSKDNLEVNSNSENNRPQSPKAKKVKGYKDHLVGLIPRAYQRVFFKEKNEVIMEDWILVQNLGENEVSFTLPDNLIKQII